MDDFRIAKGVPQGVCRLYLAIGGRGAGRPVYGRILIGMEGAKAPRDKSTDEGHPSQRPSSAEQPPLRDGTKALLLTPGHSMGRDQFIPIKKGAVPAPSFLLQRLQPLHHRSEARR